MLMGFDACRSPSRSLLMTIKVVKNTAAPVLAVRMHQRLFSVHTSRLPAVDWLIGCSFQQLIYLKGHGNEADFLGFLQKLVPYESLTLPFRPFRFWLRICGNIHVRKTTPRYHSYGESPTLRIGDTGSRRLPASQIRGVGDFPHHRLRSRLLNFLKESSLYRWYGESSTPRTSDTVSRRLPVSLSQRVADSAYHRYGESTTPLSVESGSR
jgi:hypothetical protein